MSDDYKNEVYKNFRNKSLEMIQRSGDDFMSNKFDIFLCVYSNNQNQNLFDLFNVDPMFFGDYADKKMFADLAQFMVRTGSIEVPQMISETYELKFLFNTIKKVRSKVKFERKGQLKVRLDEPMFFNMFFNMLSNNNTITTKLGREPQLYTPFTTNRMIKENLKNKTIQIDMYVKHQSLMRQAEDDVGFGAYKFLDENLKEDDEWSAGMRRMKYNDLPFWFFEDVNFLGQADPVSFDRDAANTLDMTYPFLFKRLVLISPQQRLGGGRTLDGLNPSSMKSDVRFAWMQNDQNGYYGQEEINNDVNKGNDLFFALNRK